MEYIDQERMHTSILTGQMWLQELLEGQSDTVVYHRADRLLILQASIGHPTRFRRQFGMERFVFRKLLRVLESWCGLCDTKHVQGEEQLAIFTGSDSFHSSWQYPRCEAPSQKVLLQQHSRHQCANSRCWLPCHYLSV